MKIFLSALDNYELDAILQNTKPKWNLLSYYYIRNNKDFANKVKNASEEILIDSGAHSFQFGKKVKWLEYTEQYAEFIKKFDEPKVVGYFEMDVDNIIGYDKVLELRKILEKASDKIIPVWHKNRGIEEYKKMCRDYHDKIVAIGGFKNTDIKDEQYLMFLKYAKKYNCKVHCLGMTRRKVLDKVPFDYSDSSTWKRQGTYGKFINNRGEYSAWTSKNFSQNNKKYIFVENYKKGIEMQEHYYNKWKKVCKD